MSDTPWTPGPWLIFTNDEVDGGVTLKWRQVGPFSHQTNAPTGSPAGDEADADLLIAAAAPEMADLLAEMNTPGLGEQLSPEERQRVLEGWHARARALLARIRGEAE